MENIYLEKWQRNKNNFNIFGQMKLTKKSQLKHKMKVMFEDREGKTTVGIIEECHVGFHADFSLCWEDKGLLKHEYLWLSFDKAGCLRFDYNFSNLRTVEKTLDDFSTLEIGDELENAEGNILTVLDVREKLIGLSCSNEPKLFFDYYTKGDLEREGKFHLRKEPKEVIEIEGDWYYKSDVLKKINELKPVKDK